MQANPVPPAARLVLAAACLAATVLAGPARADSRPPEPASVVDLDVVPVPSLAPEEVIRIQLEALRLNDPDDRGIGVAFRFASPGNRATTGPLERFARMLKQGPFRAMLEFRFAAYGAVEVRGDVARQRVTLFGDVGAASYVFYLSRQSAAPYEGCWMTDAVTVERPASRSI